MTTTRRSRVPDIDSIKKEPEHYNFLDTIDKRQQRLGELADLANSATTTDLIAKVNAMLQTHRTK